MQSGDKVTRSTESSIDNLTNTEECSICHKVGFHKLSCTNNNAKIAIPMAVIPTLEGEEAEEFIRKAESAERETVDWSRQMKQMQRILGKSRIANREPKIESDDSIEQT